MVEPMLVCRSTHTPEKTCKTSKLAQIYPGPSGRYLCKDNIDQAQMGVLMFKT